MMGGVKVAVKSETGAAGDSRVAWNIYPGVAYSNSFSLFWFCVAVLHFDFAFWGLLVWRLG